MISRWVFVLLLAVAVFISLPVVKESSSLDFVTGSDHSAYFTVTVSPDVASPGQIACVSLPEDVVSHCGTPSCGDLVVTDASGTVLPFSLSLPGNFKYSVPVTVTNPNSQDLTDFQVKITLDTAGLISQGKLRDNCADIRVADSSGDFLPYWLDADTCNTPSTEIWVKVPYIPANGSVTLYIYYGNSGA
ncbi:TPA: DUF2341 domain-containing protein, partial [Candidatus Micrarchaeota archaeon]|nr:DUF2341 domain-containing protein [Candidatus Micrarchaeota archaeon]